GTSAEKSIGSALLSGAATWFPPRKRRSRLGSWGTRGALGPCPAGGRCQERNGEPGGFLSQNRSFPFLCLVSAAAILHHPEILVNPLPTSNLFPRPPWRSGGRPL